MLFIKCNNSDPYASRFLSANIDYGSRRKTGFFSSSFNISTYDFSPRFVTQLKNLISFILNFIPPLVCKERIAFLKS